MSVLCVFFRRKFVPYLEGGLRPDQVERFEGHLAACRPCGELFERVRAGHEAGRRFGRLGADLPPHLPGFEEIRAGRPDGRALRPRFATPALLAVLAGLAAIVIVSGRNAALRSGAGPAASLKVLGEREFTRLSIRDFAANSGGRIVTEGFVNTVYFDDEERTLHIKLVEGPKEPEPFVICEVRDVRGLTIPQTGSLVRVYGRARFDAQPGRGWHEVNPVTEIAVLKH
jgi:hypothetical protein